MRQLRTLWRWLRGFRPCPYCGEISAKWFPVSILYRGEPPLFGEWSCLSCHATSEIMATELLNRAARELGFLDFDAWHQAQQRKELSDG